MNRPGILRRTLWCLPWMLSTHPVWANPPAVLPSTANLGTNLEEALKVGRPLVVLVSLEGCGFCKQVRERYLAPMHARDGLHAVQMDMRSLAQVRDLDGQVLSHTNWIGKRGIKMAPTVLFFGAKGAEIAERLVGASADFYGAYLDDRLRTATAAIAQSR